MTRLWPSIGWLLSIILLFIYIEARGEDIAMPKDESKPITFGDLYLSTASETSSRAALLPLKGSEDATSLLGEISIPEQPEKDSKDYLPNPSVEWIVHAALPKPTPARDIDLRFNRVWRAKYGGMTIYGRDVATGHWTFLVSANGPENVDALQFAWAYYPSWSKEAEITSPAMYQSRLKAVQHELAAFSATSVYADVPADDAFKRAKHISKLNEHYDRSITVRLIAPSDRRYSGRDVWDVMLSLGLQWGDMDCFHWQNPSDYGDSYFFSVWTSTEPGYFLPEEVEANRVNVEDLVFGYSIPRSVDPDAVFNSMLRAIEYAQKRLGGTITLSNGQPIDKEAIAREISLISAELEEIGFRPGSDNALRQF